MRNVRRLGMEQLESRTLLSTLTNESEPNNGRAAADAIAFDAADGAATLSGTISDRRDRDFFRFTAENENTVAVNVSGQGGFRAKLSIEDSAGVKLFESEPNDGVNSGSFQIQAGQSVFVRVRGQSNSMGSYRVDLTLGGTDGGTDDGDGGDTGSGNAIVEAEPNDRKAAATAADLGTDGLGQLQGTVNGRRDRDFFVLTPTTGGTLTVTVRAGDGSTAKLQVEDAQGNKLFETEPNDGIHSGSFAVTAGGQYFIRLRTHQDAPTGYLVDLALA
jgi:hypothetical protein